jgi:hypothetical protein
MIVVLNNSTNIYIDSENILNLFEGFSFGGK